MSALLRRAAAGSLAVLSLGPAGTAAAQATEEFPYLAALTTETVARAGADSRYYPFARIGTGEVVRVIGEKAGWARVATTGPAFRQTFGFIKQARAGTGQLQLAPDGRTATTTAPTDVFAPNLDAEQDPGSSWKPAVCLPADRALIIIETLPAEEEVVYRIAMPPDAEGWIDLEHLRPATPAEAATWEAALDAPAAAELAGSAGAAPRAEAGAQPGVVPLGQTPIGRARLNAGARIETPAPGGAPDAPAAGSQPRRAVSNEERRARIEIGDLEAAYARLLEEPIETAEVGPLRLLYLDLAQRHPESRTIARYARTRAKQLALWAEVQQRRAEMKSALVRARETTEIAEAARLTMERLDSYAAVGRLDTSTIYDGKRLPRLLRIREADSGRTIAYVEPDDRFDYAGLLGMTVGVTGDLVEDPAMRVTLIEPRRIDVLESHERPRPEPLPAAPPRIPEGAPPPPDPAG